MTTIAPFATVVGAARTPLPYGLFSTFTIRPEGDRWQSGVQWEAGSCEEAQGIGDWQCPPDQIHGLPKSLDPTGLNLQTASPFTVYGWHNCSPIGTSPEAAQDYATAQLLEREEARVEEAFWTADLNNSPSLRGATVIPGGAVPVAEGVALLEGFIGKAYGSLGVIHMTRAAATIAYGARVVEKSGSRLVTALGTPVAAGAGYDGSDPAGADAPAGQSWAYVTPAMFGYRSEVFTSSNVAGDLLDRGQNNLFAVAERQYLLGYDPCGYAAVLLDLAPGT